MTYPKFLLNLNSFLYLALVIMSIRLLSLGMVPLGDSTEARYGEIARLMAQTGDWITPQIEQGVPFWAKPPLSTWLSAFSIKLLGVNEFAARIPSFCIALTVLWLTFKITKFQFKDRKAFAATLILASTPLFFISSGAVMTDPALLLGSTLSMTAFWISNSTSGRTNKAWGYLFFIGIGLGLLAKGPVAMVLIGLPIILWCIWQRSWQQTWEKLPWLSGVLLMLLISFPWYILAELKTPGFLDYFLIGEHWKRFLISDWEGDLYGDAHSETRGKIWLFWVMAALPWSLNLLLQARNTLTRQRLKYIWQKHQSWNSYLLLWFLTPMLFFSLAGNILWTYVLTGLPAFAIIMSEIFLTTLKKPNINSQQLELKSHNPIMLYQALAMTGLYTLLLLAISIGWISAKPSQKSLIYRYQALQSDPEEQLTYLFQKPHSADFYSQGTVNLQKDINKINDLLQNPQLNHFATKYVEQLPVFFLDKVDNRGKYGRYYLFSKKNNVNP